MRFVSMLRVRKGDPRLIPDPVTPGFSDTEFHDAFLVYGDGSPEDFCARNFGSLLAMRVKRVFATLSVIENQCRRFSYDEVAEAIAMFLNRTQIEVFVDLTDALTDISQISMEALHGLRTSEDSHGNRFTSEEILQAAVDGARHVLKHARDNSGFGGLGSHAEVADLGAVLPVMIQLGSQLESLRNQWFTVLWGEANAFVDNRPPHPYQIDEHASRLLMLARVDLSRRQFSFARDIDEIQRANIAPEVSHKRVLMREGRHLQEARLITITIDKLPQKLQKLAVELATAHLVLVDQHIQFFLDTSHASLKGVTYRKVLDAWYCLTLLVLDDWISTQNAPVKANKSSQSPLTVLSLDELSSAFCSVLDVSPKQVKAILNFLTYKGGHQTLWSRPLLVSAKTVLLLWWPLQATHLMRLIHGWATSDTAGDGQYSDKGYHYENLVCFLLDELCRDTKTAIRFISLGPRLHVKEKAADGNEVGDVDAAFIVEKTLFILECCTVGYPAEPYEFWSVNNALEKKAKQVQRKRDHIDKNRGVIASWLRKCSKDVPLPGIERVVAIVVSNSFLLEGASNEEPYFLHLDTLFNLLSTGRSVFGGGFDHKEQEVNFHVDFLIKGGTVADAVVRFLEKPPKAEAFKACITALDNIIPPFDSTDSTGYMRTPTLEIPSHLDEIESLIRRCSFAAYISRVIQE